MPYGGKCLRSSRGERNLRGIKLPIGRIPPGGWSYPVAPGVMLKAPLPEMLYSQISEYRVRNNIPPGDPEQDVNTYFCTTYPQACVKEAHDYGLPRRDFPRAETMANRVARWASGLLHSMPAGGYQLVSQTDALARAKICQHCPKNVNWRGGCSELHAVGSHATGAAKANESDVQVDGALMGCQVTGHELTTAIWFRTQDLPITDDQRGSMPAACWRKADP